jgi:hypothetical protein
MLRMRMRMTTKWTRDVPYVSEESIERDSGALLSEYERDRNIALRPPIPIEDIVEKHLKLRIDLGDLHERLGVPRTESEPDILGAIWIHEQQIFIDEWLDPEDHPSMEGRYRFTVAHEGGGHWRLHRFLAPDLAQIGLFGGPSEPTVICRTSESKVRREWQADFYASCLLMPKHLTVEAWREHFGDTNPRIVQRKQHVVFPADADDNLTAEIQAFEQQRDDEALGEFVRPLAYKFKVSRTAMRIRLEKLGLLLREVSRQGSLSISL